MSSAEVDGAARHTDCRRRREVDGGGARRDDPRGARPGHRAGHRAVRADHGGPGRRGRAQRARCVARLGRIRAGRTRTRARSAGRDGPRARGHAGHPRIRRHREADLPGARRHRRHRTLSRVLRRRMRQVRWRDHPAGQRHLRLHRPRIIRRRRSHHPVERPDQPDDARCRAVPGRREHGGGQAVGADTADDEPRRDPHGRGGTARRGVQHRPRRRTHRRRRPGRTRTGPAHRVHRVGGRGAERRTRCRRADRGLPPGTRRQVADDRLRRRRSRTRGEGRCPRRHPELGPILLRHDAAVRRTATSTTSSSSGSPPRCRG